MLSDSLAELSYSFMWGCSFIFIAAFKMMLSKLVGSYFGDSFVEDLKADVFLLIMVVGG